ELGVAQCFGVGTCKEAQLRFQRRHLRARRSVVAALAVPLGGDQELQCTAQVPTMERHRALEGASTRTKRRVLERASDLVATDRYREGARRFFPMGASGSDERLSRELGLVALDEIKMSLEGKSHDRSSTQALRDLVGKSAPALERLPSPMRGDGRDTRGFRSAAPATCLD